MPWLTSEEAELLKLAEKFPDMVNLENVNKRLSRPLLYCFHNHNEFNALMASNPLDLFDLSNKTNKIALEEEHKKDEALE